MGILTSHIDETQKKVEPKMDKGIYTALSGGLAKARELELVANNLANANTPGFKRDTGTFSEYLTELRRPDSVDGLKREISAATIEEGRPQGDKSFVEMDGVYTSYQQGSLQQTGRSLDFGLDGKGFFEVLTPSGVRYTRQGNFSRSAEGLLVTVNGFPVLSSTREVPSSSKQIEITTTGRVLSSTGEAAPLAVRDAPPEERVIRLGNGPVTITPEGFIVQDGSRLGRLSVAEFHESQWLEKVGSSYFRNTAAENLKSDPSASQIHQGFLEGSNVNPVREMTKLIEVTRSYESHMQAIKTYQEIDARSVNDIAKER